MPKKVVTRLQIAVQGKHEDIQPDNWGKFRDFVVMLGAASGIFVGVLWLGGRFYAYGYYTRIGVPLYFLDFSIWEYGENYILTIFIGVMKFILDNFWMGVTEIIGLAIVFIILWVIQKLWKNLKIRKAFDVIERINKKFLMVLYIAAFFLSFLSVYRQGDDDAYRSLIQARSVTVYSKEFLALDSPSIIMAPDQGSSLYKFSGLRLSTYNSGKYYLFRELEQDQASCKPQQVFVVTDNDSITLLIDGTPETPLPCSAPPSATVTPIP